MSSEQLSICPKQTQSFILSFSDFGIIKHLLDRASPNIRFVVLCPTSASICTTNRMSGSALSNKCILSHHQVRMLINELYYSSASTDLNLLKLCEQKISGERESIFVESWVSRQYFWSQTPFFQNNGS